MEDRAIIEMSEALVAPKLIAREGWIVMHLFYRAEFPVWQSLTGEQQRQAKTRFTEIVQEIRETPDTQLLTLSMVSPKADLGLMLLTSDLHNANAFEKQLNLAFGPDIFTPVYSYLSMTERSEYTTSEEQYRKDLEQEGKKVGTSEFEAEVAEFNARMGKYLQHRLYPNLPEWPIVCFYPMSKRRTGQDNWYSLPFEERKRLMGGHATMGRKWHGKILQLITGSTGLDEYEWGVTLFGHDIIDIKEIVYNMRFDEVSARYGEFGDFFIGLQLPLDQLFTRIAL